MRLPLFAALACAKRNPLVPQELRFSGILSLQWLTTSNKRLWFKWTAPIDGSQCIEAICARLLRNKGPVRFQDVAELRARIAPTIYENNTQIALYKRRHVATMTSGCFVKDERHPGYGQRLYTSGERGRLYMPAIPIAEAPKKPCRWCQKPVFYKPEWVDGRGTVRCNSTACRHIEHLSNMPQSRGGVDLTPTQRKVVPRSHWDEQRVANYLLRKSHDYRNRSHQVR
jgi:hypothetical protein